MEFPGDHGSFWHLRATRPWLVGGYGHNFEYGGQNVGEVNGEAEILLDVEANTGTAVVTFTGTVNPEQGVSYIGEIRIVYNITPRTDAPPFQEGGAADFVFMHGDTGQGPPIMPKLRAFLASWSSLQVFVDDQMVYGEDVMEGHIMYTERVRDEATRAIYADAARTSFYSP